MATFCLLLAVASFVLAVGPSRCYCDRPHIDSAFYRTSNGDGFDPESIWSIISRKSDSTTRGRRRTEGITGLTLDSSAPWQRVTVSAREVMVLESLLNRYRKYMVAEFAHFDDVCSLLYDEGGNDASSAVPVESYNESTEISSGQLVEGQMDDHSGSGGEKIPNGLKKDELSAVRMKLSRPLRDYCSKNARRFYHCLLDELSDPQLVGIIDEYLQTTCIGRDEFLLSDSLPAKRDTPRYVSKQKFHSWGGKRSDAQIVYPWGGKRTMVRPHKQPKVVIRNPFHSWGGKRNDPALEVSAAAAQ